MSEENIIQLDFSEEMKTSYRDYAMSVIDVLSRMSVMG